MKLFFVLFSIICFSCSTVQDKKLATVSDPIEAQRLLNILTENNNNRPTSLSADVLVRVLADKRKFTAKGHLDYNAAVSSLRLKLVDPVLRMLMADLIMVSGSLKTYVPMDNTVYIQAGGKKNVLHVGFDPYFISSTAMGVFPIIDHVKSSAQYSVEGEYKKIEINNDEYRESIMFVNDIPRRIEISMINGSKKIVIDYLESAKKEALLFFNEIRAISEPDGNSFILEYNTVKMNGLIDSKAFQFSTPAGTKIVESR